MAQAQSDEVIAIAYTWGDDEFVALSKAARSRFFGLRGETVFWIARGVIWIIQIALLVFAYRILGKLHLPYWLFWTLILLGAMALLYAGATLPRRQRKRLLRLSRAYQDWPFDIELEADNSGVRARMQGAASQIDWGRFERAEETQQHILLFMARLRALAIPKRAFREATQLKAFQELIRTHIHNYMVGNS